ncbi:4a-hydroxytetrahydrobiopterin dehydratase [candidate division KSB1 bacterium]|nr:4a-hydroxytetrahydrobiopterin dehydratase [candidate division KSB1 bacterium]
MKLTDQAIKEQLAQLEGWSLEGKQIWKRFECKNFLSAVEFVNRLAKEAEDINHHPDILISNWNRVTIHLTTHSQGELTEIDFQLAKKIDKVFDTIT